MRKKAIFAVLFLTLILASGAVLLALKIRSDSSKAVAFASVTFPEENFSGKVMSEKLEGRIFTVESEYENSRGDVRISERTYFGLSKEDSRNIVKIKRALLESIFSERPSPYPGAISQQILCPKELLPKKYSFGEEPSVVYLLPAGERENYGVCSEDLVEYNSIYAISECRGTPKEIRIFFGKDLEPPSEQELLAALLSLCPSAN